jgi:D-3-phosphoglycerate dehydrogenase
LLDLHNVVFIIQENLSKMASTTKPIVYVLDPYHPDAIALLQAQSHINLILPSSPKAKEWHKDAIAVIIRSTTRLTARDFSSAPHLKLVVKQGVGVDNIDLSAASAYGVAVYNTPGLNSEAVAELALTLPLALARRVGEFDRRIRRGEMVKRSEILGVSLFRKTVGVVGMGNIGFEVAKKWRGACEGKIVAYDPVAKGDAWSEIPHERVGTLQELLKASDVVTLHVPLLESTRGMIGAKELAMMKESAILVNCARGGIVDEVALVKALKEEVIWGAVLDAVENEPPTLEVYRELLSCERVILTPHAGAGTVDNQSRSGVAAVEIMLAVLRGEKDVSGKLD